MKFCLRQIAVLLTVAATTCTGYCVSVSSFEPRYGAPDDPFFITIFGSGFQTGPLEVRFNGVLAPVAFVTDAAGTVIQARVPVGATTGPISVKVGSSVAQSVPLFTVIGPGPYIHSFTPSVGAAGTEVLLTGAHFAAVTNVLFNGIRVQGPLAATSDRELRVIAPPGVTSGPIRARSRDGIYTTISNFFVPPVITGFSPTNGRPGTNIVIRGTNFLGTTAVLFKGAGGNFTLPADSITVLSNGAVKVTVPFGALSGKVRVIAPAGSADTASQFRVQPLITGFSPGFGAVGKPVLITGANLDGGNPIVRFNGVAAAVSGVTFSQLTAVVPPGAATGYISIQNTNGAYTNAALFYLPPSISSLSSSNAQPGKLITIVGQNFLDATDVSFAGAATTYYVSNNTTIGAVVPLSVSTGPVSITTPGGQTVSSAKFYATPRITSFSPAHGLPGTLVTILGQNFTDASSVTFNGLRAASFSVLNDSSIQAIVPTEAQTGPITVHAPAGSATSVALFTLDYATDLQLTITNAPASSTISSNIAFSFLIFNTGNQVASGVRLTNTQPASATLISTTMSQGSLVNSAARPLVFNIGAVNPGAQVFVQIVFTTGTAGPFENTATVSMDSIDLQPTNNSITTTTQVLPLPILSVLNMGTSRVRLSWPKALTGFAVEYNSNIFAPGSWSLLNAPQISNGELITVTDTNPGPFRVYRLMK